MKNEPWRHNPEARLQHLEDKLKNKKTQIRELEARLAEAKEDVIEADATSNGANDKWRKAVDKQTELESQLAEIDGNCPNEVCGGKLELICNYCGESALEKQDE